jgi:hypothetical protein
MLVYKSRAPQVEWSLAERQPCHAFNVRSLCPPTTLESRMISVLQRRKPRLPEIKQHHLCH